MPKQEMELAIILREFDDDTQLAEALLFPEVSRYADDPKLLQRAVVRNAARLLEAEELPKLFARAAPADLATFEVTIRLAPPPAQTAWRSAVDLRLDVVWWSHHDAAHIAFVPALGIEVVSTKLADLVPPGEAPQQIPPLLERHIRAELMRRRATSSLKELPAFARTRAVRVVRASCAAEIRTPKQLAAGAQQESEQKKSTLEQVAVDLTKESLAEAYEVEPAVLRLAEAIGAKAAKSVLLIGQAGVGKTAVLHELVRRRGEFGLGGTAFWATSGARLVAGMSGYGMWQERCAALWREAAENRAVIHFGNLVELMNTGKSEHGAQGLASFFRARFMSGAAVAVLECTPEQLPLIEREDPALVRAFHQLTIEEPTPEAGRRILAKCAAQQPRIPIGATRRERRAAALRSAQAAAMTAEGLATLDRLHRRYAGYSTYPGRPLRFLRNLLQQPTEALEPVLDARAVTAAFAKETGLPLFLLDDDVAFDNAQARRWFGERVIGQPAAVDLIVDLLATVKAGLARPRRPVASLLFIGPTGVGKTELARSTAKFFFADENRLARFDMSEYADALAVTRLIGGAFGNEGTLTARVREQPFSVLLFDEFEKADQSFFDLLLQILGEGRLTDGRGRLADFTNSIVVMTSNLGAERFRRARPGFRGEAHAEPADGDRERAARQRAAQKHFTRAVQDFLRPEIFNRLDHIVPFLPLERETVRRIAERELALLQQRDGMRLRGVELRAGEEVLELLARRGYDARYGARPLKRLVEREVLQPLAVDLNQRPPHKKTGGAATALVAQLRVEVNRLRVSVEESGSQRPSELASPGGDAATPTAHVARLSELRRRVQRLGRSSSVAELRNVIWRLTEVERRLARAARPAQTTVRAAKERHAWMHPAEAGALARLPEHQRLAALLERLGDDAATAEDHALLTLYGRDFTTTAEPTAFEALDAELRQLLRQLLDLRASEPHRVVLAVFGENRRCLFELARAYYVAALASEMNFKLAYYTPDVPPEVREAAAVNLNKQDDEATVLRQMFGRQVVRREANDPARFLESAPEATGLVCEITGSSAYAAYTAEHGLHAFIEPKATHYLLAHTSDAHFAKYLPPASLAQRGAITRGERRRTYQRAENYVEDHALGVRRAWESAKSNSEQALAATLKLFIDENLAHAAEKLIDE